MTPRPIRVTTDTDSNTVPVLVLTRPDWWADALCREVSVVARVGCNFVDAERNKAAKARALAECAGCLVRVACLEYAIADPDLVGIWGGADTPARKAIRSNRARQMEAKPHAAS